MTIFYHKSNLSCGGGDYIFIDEFNEVKIRKALNRYCRCKVCDNYVNGKDIVYLKSIRLLNQPFHICIPCWKEIDKMVDDYLNNKETEK